MDRKSFLKSVGAASAVPIGSAFAKSNDVTVHFLKPKHIEGAPNPFFIKPMYRGYTYSVCDGFYYLKKSKNPNEFIAEREDDTIRLSKVISSENPFVQPVFLEIAANPSRRITKANLEARYWSFNIANPKTSHFRYEQSVRYLELYGEKDFKVAAKCISGEVKKRIQILIDAGCTTVYVEMKEKAQQLSCIHYEKSEVGSIIYSNFIFIGYQNKHGNPSLRTMNHISDVDGCPQYVVKNEITTNNDIDRTIYNYSKEKDYGFLV